MPNWYVTIRADETACAIHIEIKYPASWDIAVVRSTVTNIESYSVTTWYAPSLVVQQC